MISSRPTSATMGSAIRTRREELGLTQEELAARIGGGIRQSEISRLERGRVTLPRRARLEAIAAALNLPVGELLARSGWAGAGDAFGPVAAGTPQPAAGTSPSPDPNRFPKTPWPRCLPATSANDGAVDRLHDARRRALQIIETFHDLERRSACTLERIATTGRERGPRSA